jgi:hypothetical protein
MRIKKSQLVKLIKEAVGSSRNKPQYVCKGLKACFQTEAFLDGNPNVTIKRMYDALSQIGDDVPADDFDIVKLNYDHTLEASIVYDSSNSEYYHDLDVKKIEKELSNYLRVNLSSGAISVSGPKPYNFSGAGNDQYFQVSFYLDPSSFDSGN